MSRPKAERLGWENACANKQTLFTFCSQVGVHSHLHWCLVGTRGGMVGHRHLEHWMERCRIHPPQPVEVCHVWLHN
jgi:hypothetical protein